MDDSRSEEIKDQIAQTRSNLVNKLESLEEQVVEPAAAAVAETVTMVKEAVGNTAEAVQSTVKMVTQTFDLPEQVRKYPWRMIGAGIATGFLLAQFSKSAPPNARRAKRASLESSRLDASDCNGNGRSHHQSPLDETPAPRQTEPQQPRIETEEKPQGRSRLATDLQSIVIQSLIPAWQGVLGAVIGEVFRHAKAQPASMGEVPRSSPDHRYGETDPDGWIDPVTKNEPQWADRLRSTPR